MTKLIYCVVLTFVTFTSLATGQENQMKAEITFYQSYDPMEWSNDFFLGVIGAKIPDMKLMDTLGGAQFQNLQAYCGSGIWAVYDDTNYKMATESIIAAPHVCTYCVPGIQCAILDSIKSARYLGNPNFEVPGLSLLSDFNKGNWGGEETYIGKSEKSFDPPICATYWAFTSNTSWTLYAGPNFTGDTVCIQPDTTSTGELFKWGWGKLNYWSIGSVRQGCISDFVMPHAKGQTAETEDDPEGAFVTKFKGQHESEEDDMQLNFIVCKGTTDSTPKSTESTTPSSGNIFNLASQLIALVLVLLGWSNLA